MVHIAGLLALQANATDPNKCLENVKEQAYLALVGPQFEYGRCSWDLDIQKQIKDI